MPIDIENAIVRMSSDIAAINATLAQMAMAESARNKESLQHHADQDKRISELEAFKNKFLGACAVSAFGGSGIGAALVGILNVG